MLDVKNDQRPNDEVHALTTPSTVQKDREHQLLAVHVEGNAKETSEKENDVDAVDVESEMFGEGKPGKTSMLFQTIEFENEYEQNEDEGIGTRNQESRHEEDETNVDQQDRGSAFDQDGAKGMARGKLADLQRLQALSTSLEMKEDQGLLQAGKEEETKKKEEKEWKGEKWKRKEGEGGEEEKGEEDEDEDEKEEEEEEEEEG